MTDKKQDKKPIDPAVKKPGDLLGITPPAEDLKELKEAMKKAKADAVKILKESKITDGDVTCTVVTPTSNHTFTFKVVAGELGEATVVQKPKDEESKEITTKNSSGIEGIAMSGKNADEIANKLVDGAALRADFWKKRNETDLSKIDLTEKTWRQELGEVSAKLPKAVMDYLDLPIEVQIMTIRNALSADLSRVESRDFQRMAISASSSKRLLDNKFLSLEYAIANMVMDSMYDYGFGINANRLMSGVVSLADQVFARNNAAKQFGDKMVFQKNDIETKLRPYQMLADALLAWALMSNDDIEEHSGNDKEKTSLRHSFLIFQSKVSDLQIEEIKSISKIMSFNVVKAVARNWIHFIAKDDKNLSLADVLYSNGSSIESNATRQPYEFGVRRELYKTVLTNEMHHPLYQVQKRMLKGELEMEAECVAAGFIGVLLDVGKVIKSTDLVSVDAGVSIAGNYNRTMVAGNYQIAGIMKPPSVFETTKPYTPQRAWPRYGSEEDKKKLTAENFSEWMEQAIGHVSGILSIRRMMFTRHDDNLMVRPIADMFNNRSKRPVPETPDVTVIPFGGSHTSAESISNVVEKMSIGEIISGMKTYTLRQVGLEWSSLLNFYSTKMTDQGRVNEGWSRSLSGYGCNSNTPVPITARIALLVKEWDIARTRQREYYANLVKLIDAAIARHDVRIYDIVTCADDLLLHTLNLAEASVHINNALVYNLCMEGVVIDEMFPNGINGYFGGQAADRYGGFDGTFRVNQPTLKDGMNRPDYHGWNTKSWAD